MHGWTQVTRLKPVLLLLNKELCLFIYAMDINKTGREHHVVPAWILFNISLTESIIDTEKIERFFIYR
jgi:hypothetical protein